MGKNPEQIGRKAGEAIANAIADGLENVLLRLADAIAQNQTEQAELRDEVVALSNRIEALTGQVMAHHRQLLQNAKQLDEVIPLDRR